MRVLQMLEYGVETIFCTHSLAVTRHEVVQFIADRFVYELFKNDR